ncbi:MAG: EcsC family protein [Pseudomonadota bacterium]
MTGLLPTTPLTQDHHQELARAVLLLERSSLAMRFADIAGQPVNRVLNLLPKIANRQLTKVLEAAIVQCLEVAIHSLDDTPIAAPSPWLSKVMTGVTGGVAGFFGVPALPVELPLTTMFMLQSIAEIARHNGEDLRQPETRLACLEVFALGDRRSGKRADVGYYATRALLARLTADIAALAVQRQAVDIASPVASRMVSEIVSRFGLAVSERAAASAIPIIGAFGGATVNMIFTDHFAQIAQGHFIIRRLERQYGGAAIQTVYRSLSEKMPDQPAS